MHFPTNEQVVHILKGQHEGYVYVFPSRFPVINQADSKVSASAVNRSNPFVKVFSSPDRREDYIWMKGSAIDAYTKEYVNLPTDVKAWYDELQDLKAVSEENQNEERIQELESALTNYFTTE